MINNCIKYIQNLLPSACSLCLQPTTDPSGLCRDCQATLTLNTVSCSQCAHPLPISRPTICGSCVKKPPAFDDTFAPLQYRDYVRQAIMQFKFNANLTAGRVLARLFIQQVLQHQPQKPDVIMPVPLHYKKTRQRGFNQSDWIARQVSRELKISFDRQSLQRTRPTPAQHELPRHRRLNNLKHAFSLKTPTHFGHVVIFDDVITTGTTANELARQLKAAGVRQVSIWAVARAVAQNA